MERSSNNFCFQISAPMAMFGTPTSKLGCEMISYPMPTYSSVIGMLNAIYHRDGLEWVVLAVRVMNKVEYQNMTIKYPTYKNKKDRFIYSYLINPKYQVLAYYKMDKKYINDENADCYLDADEEIEEAIRRGGNNIVFLGKRHGCMALVEPCEWMSGEGYYDNKGKSEPVRMFYKFEFIGKRKRKRINKVGFCMQYMENGVINFEKRLSHIYEVKR